MFAIMTTILERVRAHRERRRNGVAVLPVEVDEAALADVLVAARLLDPNKTDDRAAVVEALQKLIAVTMEN
jgi:hypothetical protein